MKSIRTNPTNGAPEGDERTRLLDYGKSGVGCAFLGPVRYLTFSRLTLVWRSQLPEVGGSTPPCGWHAHGYRNGEAEEARDLQHATTHDDPGNQSAATPGGKP